MVVRGETSPSPIICTNVWTCCKIAKERAEHAYNGDTESHEQKQAPTPSLNTSVAALCDMPLSVTQKGKVYDCLKLYVVTVLLTCELLYFAASQLQQPH